MGDTPKKVTCSNTSGCFLCSSTVEAKERVRIFGRSTDLAGDISSTLDINLESFDRSLNSTLYVCLKCYRKINKIKKLENDLREQKQSLKTGYHSNQDHRIKRLQNDQEEIAKRPLAAKTLDFSAPTASTSSSSSPRTLTLPTLPISPINGQNSATTVTLKASQLSQLCSIASTPKLKHRPAQTKVSLCVEYPSKTVNKTLGNDVEAIGKALAHGSPSRFATAVLKSKSFRSHIIQRVLRIVSGEITGLCSRKRPSLLRKCAKDDIANFDLKKICEEWKERAPVFYSFLLTTCTTNKQASWFPSVALAGSILLKQRNKHMNTTGTIIGILLKTRSVEANLNRFSKLKLTSTNENVLKKMETVGELHDLPLQNAKQRIVKEQLEIKEAMEEIKTMKNQLDESPTQNPKLQSCYIDSINVLRKKKMLSHPGFTVPFDNIDMHLNRRQMTMTEQNKDVHWVNHEMVENRVSGNHLPSEGQSCNILDVPNAQFFPSAEDQRKQRESYIILVSRILVDYFDSFSIFKGVCIRHIPHKYSKEMSQQSNKTPLGIIFKSENVNEEMLTILQQFHTYLPKTDDSQYDSQIFTGDQLTIERAVNVLASVSNGYTTEDRLEGINMQIADWHAGVKILELIYRRFYSTQSDVDHCTMYSDRSLINRRNVTNDPHSNYRPNRDFFLIILKSRIIAGAMKVLGLDSKESQPVLFKIPDDIASKTNVQKLAILHTAAGMVVDKYVFAESNLNQLINNVITEQEKQDIRDNQQLTPDGRFPCRFPGCKKSFVYDGKSRRNHEKTHEPPPTVTEQPPEQSLDKPKKDSEEKDIKQDDMYLYNSALVADGLYFLNFLDAAAEGDGERILRQYKYMLMYCRADNKHSTKYALECLYQFFLVFALLSPRDRERFTWNRSVNNNGIIGKNIPLDLDVEHSNNYLKQAMKNLGPNLTEKAVSRICKSEKGIRKITLSMDETLKQARDPGKHSSSSTAGDLNKLIKRLIEHNAMEKMPLRVYNHFDHFEVDPFKALNASEMYSWINEHKKNMSIGIRAR